VKKLAPYLIAFLPLLASAAWLVDGRPQGGSGEPGVESDPVWSAEKPSYAPLNLAGQTVSNGSFRGAHAGDGGGLTNLPAANASSWSGYKATQNVDVAGNSVTGAAAVLAGNLTADNQVYGSTVGAGRLVYGRTGAFDRITMPGPPGGGPVITGLLTVASGDTTADDALPTAGWVKQYAGGGGGSDNLGNHTATQNLSLAGFSLADADEVRFDDPGAWLSTAGQIRVRSSMPLNGAYVFYLKTDSEGTWHLLDLWNRDDGSDPQHGDALAFYTNTAEAGVSGYWRPAPGTGGGGAGDNLGSHIMTNDLDAGNLGAGQAFGMVFNAASEPTFWGFAPQYYGLMKYGWGWSGSLVYTTYVDWAGIFMNAGGLGIGTNYVMTWVKDWSDRWVCTPQPPSGGGGGGSQSPLTNDLDAGQFAITNLARIGVAANPAPGANDFEFHGPWGVEMEHRYGRWAYNEFSWTNTFLFYERPYDPGTHAAEIVNWAMLQGAISNAFTNGWGPGSINFLAPNNQTGTMWIVNGIITEVEIQ
jgi:hypothetical protein